MPAQNEVDGQDRLVKPPSLARSDRIVHAPAPPVGLRDTTTFPTLSPATHMWIDVQEIDTKPAGQVP
jgi:hypothetical protein